MSKTMKILDQIGIKKLLTYKTAAELLDCSASKVQKMVLAGEIPFLKVGNETRIRQQDLEDWIENQMQRCVQRRHENCSEDNPEQALPKRERRGHQSRHGPSPCIHPA